MRCGRILSSLIGHFKDSCIMIYFALVKNFVVDMILVVFSLHDLLGDSI